MLSWLLSTMQIAGTAAAVGLASDMKLNTTVAPFILRGAHLLGVDSANCPMSLRQTLWNKLAVDWRPDRVHDQVRTIDFDELPEHFDAYLKGHVRGRTVVRIGADSHPRCGSPRSPLRGFAGPRGGAIRASGRPFGAHADGFGF
jgi:hypothetical protein